MSLSGTQTAAVISRSRCARSSLSFGHDCDLGGILCWTRPHLDIALQYCMLLRVLLPTVAFSSQGLLIVGPGLLVTRLVRLQYSTGRTTGSRCKREKATGKMGSTNSKGSSTAWLQEILTSSGDEALHDVVFSSGIQGMPGSINLLVILITALANDVPADQGRRVAIEPRLHARIDALAQLALKEYGRYSREGSDTTCFLSRWQALRTGSERTLYARKLTANKRWPRFGYVVRHV